MNSLLPWPILVDHYKSDKLAPKVLALVAEGQSYRQIGRHLDLSKNTVLGIVKRERQKQVNEMDSTNTDGYETQ